MKHLTSEQRYTIFVGTISEKSGDVDGEYAGGYDIWVAKIDSVGNLIDQTIIGGDAHEVPYFITPDNTGNFLISAQTRSSFGGVTNYGMPDFLLIGLDNNLDTTFTFQAGGSDIDALTDICVNDSGDTIFIIGRTASNNGYIYNNHGEFDVWISKIYKKDTTTQIINNNLSMSELNIYPNPAENYIIVQNIENQTVTITDLSGKIIFKEKISTKNQKIDIKNLTCGIYIISAHGKHAKFIKN